MYTTPAKKNEGITNVTAEGRKYWKSGTNLKESTFNPEESIPA